MRRLRWPTGNIVSVPDEQVGSALATGYTNVSPVEAGSTIAAAPAEDNGLAGAADAAATSTLSGATLGASDVALKYLLSKGQAKTVSADRAAHPYISGAGQIAGTILPALAAPESLLARSPAGLTSSLGRALAERAGVGEAGLAARAAIHAGSGAAEGAIYGGGQYLTDVALDDNQPLSVEGFVGSVGNGALFAAPVGGAFTLGEGALIRARSLFPRGEVTSAAANGIQKEATSTLSSAIGDGDQMAQQVRQQVALNNANKGVAQSNEQITRRAFGGADPATIVDQAAAGADSTQLSEALHAYDQSRAQLLDWVHAEADPDLEAALSNLRAPGVQGPGANGIGIYPDLEQSLENLRAPHSVQSRDLVPQGEFGAPGKGGIKSPEELLQAAADAGAPEPTGQPDATRAGRPGRPAQGTAGPPEPVDTSAAAPRPESSRVSYQVERHGDPIDGKFEIKGSDGSSKIIDRSEMDDWVDEHLPKGFSESGINTRAPFALESGMPSAGSLHEE